MGLGAIFILLGIILAVMSLFVDAHAHRLVAAAVILIGIGALIGSAGGFVT